MNEPKPDQDALDRTWALAAGAQDPPPDDEAVEAALARFWGLAATASPSNHRPPMTSAARLRPPRWLWPVAAGILLVLGVGAGMLLERSGFGADAAQQPQFLLLIRGDEAGVTPQAQAQIVSALGAWAQTLRAVDQFRAGDELAPEGHLLFRDDDRLVKQPYARSADAVGGYFIITAADYAAALAVARTCPYLDYGGRVEVRPIISH